MLPHVRDIAAWLSYLLMEKPTSWDQYGEFGSASVVQKLVSRGANPFESNHKQQNALHLASGAGGYNSVVVLLS
jgi:hypothetical protein